MDSELSKAVLGETLSTDVGDRGSYAASRTHNEVRKEVTKADADLLSDTLNRTLIRWDVELNLPGAKPPKLWRNFEEAEDLNTRVTRDKTLFDMGWKLKKEAVSEIYGDFYEEQQQEGAATDEEFLANSGVVNEESPPETEKDTTDMSELDFGSIIDRILKWNDLSIGVEYLPGQVRFPGRKTSKKLRSGYGHIRGFVGADGEALDCYIFPELFKDEAQGQDALHRRIFQVSQLSAEDGDFDEHKFMLGYKDMKSAREAYLTEMPISFFGGITEVTLADLEQYRRKPVNLSTFGLELPITANANFAEPKVDAADFYTKQLQDGTAPLIANWIRQINQLVEDSHSLEEVRDRIFDLFTASELTPQIKALIGLTIVNLYSTHEFSEADKIPVTDAASLLTLKQVLEETYLDGITALKEVYLEGDTFTGIFEDKVSNSLTKRDRFTVSTDEVSYKLENPEDVANFSEALVEFAAKGKNCVKGQSCGGSCISKNKECKKVPSTGAKKQVAELKKKVTDGGASTVKTGVDTTASKSKTESAKKVTTARISKTSAKKSTEVSAESLEAKGWNKVDAAVHANIIVQSKKTNPRIGMLVEKALSQSSDNPNISPQRTGISSRIISMHNLTINRISSKHHISQIKDAFGMASGQTGVAQKALSAQLEQIYPRLTQTQKSVLANQLERTLKNIEEDKKKVEPALKAMIQDMKKRNVVTKKASNDAWDRKED
jgi:hypothetical protein